MSADQTLQTADTPPARPEDPGRRLPRIVGVVRIMLGLVLLWAFADKIAGLGGPTPEDRSVLSGASATQGYLASVDGTFADVFTAMAGHPVVDALFLIGLGGSGLALVLGVATRLAAAGTVAVMGPLYLSSLPLEQNPLIDQHLMYCVLAVGLAALGAGNVLGLGRAWARTRLVRAVPILR